MKTALNCPLGAVLKLLGPRAEEEPAPLISVGPKIVLTIDEVSDRQCLAGRWTAAATRAVTARQAAEVVRPVVPVPVPLAARAGVATPDAGAVAVLAGEGTTGHRRDCALISHREDPRVMTGTEVNPPTCRVCRQSVG